jgi:hypothetical protein
MGPARAAPGCRPPLLVAARQRSRPYGDAGHAEPAEQGAVNPGLRVPPGPGRSPCGNLRAARLLDPADTEPAVPALIDLSAEVNPADTVAAVIRHPREAHPRSPERAAVSRPWRPFPAAMVAALGSAVYYRHGLLAGRLRKSEYVTYPATGR